MRDLHQDRGEKGGGGELEDPGDQTLPVTERRQVEDLVRSELSDCQSQGLLSALWWNDNSHTAPSAACNRRCFNNDKLIYSCSNQTLSKCVLMRNDT